MELIQHKNKWYVKSDTGYREVIASTDPKLTVDYKGYEHGTGDRVEAKIYLPNIPQSFIKKYVKNPVDKVLVEVEKYMTAGWVPSYSNPDNSNLDTPAEMDYRIKLTNNEIIINYGMESQITST